MKVFRFLVLTCAWVCFRPTALAQPYVAASTEWRPFIYTDEYNTLRGVSTDIARQVFRQANIDVQFVSYPANRMQVMLDKEQIDISYAESPGWTREEAASQYVFSVPYLAVREHLYFAADDPLSSVPLNELRDVTIGMIRGYTYRALDSAFQEKRISKLETSEDSALLELLANKRVNAVAMVDDLYDYLATTHQIDPDRFRRGALLNESNLSIMLLNRHASLLPKINAAILDMQRRGELQRIRDAYLPSASTKACVVGGKSC
ncbi:transporter substrate-binding domain-containing protein [Pseudomonas viridiflava]|uniref:substrate-binding periplasmic protein n=1 Tax=Pseudomonas viridiflava TaxID=33069 RepID=UPI00178083B9|nr:transporter substrate-binding domain-containing protein [Pseudomonas viridiflava]MBD8188250.1 transporter substrate-binding domain-containing protein [Pseudomonas viridiflava]